MNSSRTLKDQQRDKHPGFDNYLECMTRALFAGLSAFTLGFSSVYFTQKLIQKRFPYPLRNNILISTLVGTLASYKVSSDRTKSCQSGWLAAEDKHTALTTIGEDDK